MSKTIIRSDKAPQPIGPYNQAVSVNDLIYASGQIPIDLKTGDLISGGVSEQAELVIQYIKAILESAGSGLDKVIKATVFLKDMNDFAKMNEVYKKYFDPKTAPARSTIQVARLPKDALVEIEVVATR